MASRKRSAGKNIHFCKQLENRAASQSTAARQEGRDSTTAALHVDFVLVQQLLEDLGSLGGAKL